MRLQAIALPGVRVDHIRLENQGWIDAGYKHSSLSEPAEVARQGAAVTEKMSSSRPGRVPPAIPYKLGGRKRLPAGASDTALKSGKHNPHESLTPSSETKPQNGNGPFVQADEATLRTGTSELEEQPEGLLVESQSQEPLPDSAPDADAEKIELEHVTEEHGQASAAEAADAPTNTGIHDQHYRMEDLPTHSASTLKSLETTNADLANQSENNNRIARPDVTEMLVDGEPESVRPEPRIHATPYSFEELRLQANQHSDLSIELAQGHRPGVNHNTISSAGSIPFQGLDPSGSTSPAPGYTGQRHVDGEMRPHELLTSRVANHQSYGPQDTRHNSFSTTSIQSPPVPDNFNPSNAPFPRPPPGLHFNASQQGPVYRNPSINSLPLQIHNHRLYFDGRSVGDGQQGSGYVGNHQIVQINGQRSSPSSSARVSPGEATQVHHTRHEKDINPEGQLHRPSRLMDHLSHEWNIPELSDCTLHLKPSDGDIEPLSLTLHILILAQSPRLRLLTKHNSQHRPLHIRLISRTGALLDLEAFIFALKYLYGQPLLHLIDNRAYMYINDPLIVSTPSFRTALALAYMAAGHFLQIEEIVHCGFDLVLHNLSWATIPRIVSFVTYNEMNTTWRGEHDKMSRPYANDISLADGPSHPLVGRLVNAVVDFIADNWPMDFYFLPDVGNADELARFSGPPALSTNESYAERQHETGNGRLTAIRFGDMSSAPSPQHNGPAGSKSVNVALSSILVSLPTGLLQHLLQHPLLCTRQPAQRRLSTAREVVAERERRRRQALDAMLATGRPGVMAGGSLLGMESVEVGEGGPEGFRITCQRGEA